MATYVPWKSRTTKGKTGCGQTIEGVLGFSDLPVIE
jgi:hypothetical protein